MIYSIPSANRMPVLQHLFLNSNFREASILWMGALSKTISYGQCHMIDMTINGIFKPLKNLLLKKPNDIETLHVALQGFKLVVYFVVSWLGDLDIFVARSPLQFDNCSIFKDVTSH